MDIKLRNTKQKLLNALDLDIAILVSDIETAMLLNDKCFEYKNKLIRLKTLKMTRKDLALDNWESLPDNLKSALNV